MKRPIDHVKDTLRNNHGIKTTGRRGKKSTGGSKAKQDRWNGQTRKEARKSERKRKKQRRNMMYLSRFSHSSPTVPEELRTLKRRGEKTDVSSPKNKKKKLGVGHQVKTDIATDGSTKMAEADGLTRKTAVKKKDVSKSEKRGKKGQAEHGEDRGLGKETAKSRNMFMGGAVAREEVQLRQLEKQLKLKKRTTLPKAFMDDGLDYLLDVVDGRLSEDPEDMESEISEKESKSVKGSPGKKRRSQLEEDSEQELGPPKKRKVRFADEIDSDEDNFEDGERSDEGEFPEEASNDDDDEDNVDEMEEEGDEEGDGDDTLSDDEKESGKGGELKEDIYGRLVDSKGQVVSASGGGGAYVPPAKRAAMLAASGLESAELEHLKKQMKGLLNRVNEFNMQSIANAMEELYMQHSRASVNQTLFMLVMDAVMATVLTPERLVAEMAMLVAVLHGNVGSEVGAYFLQHMSKRFEDLRQEEEYGGGHTMDNLLLLLCHLYNFKVAHHRLLFDIMKHLVESFGHRDIELLLLVLRSAGFYLRRDDPESLGNQITSIQQKAGELEESGREVPARVRFMLEVLVAVRNNNVRRVPGADLERSDRLRQLTAKFVRDGGLGDNQLNLGLKDLMQAEDKGRWWIVGSAWVGRTPETSSTNAAEQDVSQSSNDVKHNKKLMRAAKKLRLTTELRRSIFFSIMSSEDYEDAFMKILNMQLKGQEREVVVVVTLCCKHQAMYNPFYSYLLQKLAAYDRKFKIATQFHFWDVFKTMDELSEGHCRNLALMMAHMLTSNSLSLSVFKVLEFGCLSKAMTVFLKTVFTSVLTTNYSAEMFKINQFCKLAMGLKLFLVKHLPKDTDNLLEALETLGTRQQLML